MITRTRLLASLLGLIASAAVFAAAGPARATEIWSGRTYGFAKAPFASPALPQNQDIITGLVAITRANTEGIFNITQEPGYTHYSSPVGTEWATGDAVDYGNLTFQSWEDWNGANPMSMIGVDACVHLIQEDIYIDIVFDDWGGGTSGGRFAYRRGLPLATPAKPNSWGRIKLLFR